MSPSPTKRNVTMRDIAETLGISVSAVSLSLNNKPGVTDELRRRVVDEARRKGYPMNKLQERRSNGSDLGFLINREYLRGGDPVYARILSEAQAEAERRGYHLLIGALSPAEARAGKLPQFFNNGVSGVIVDDGFDEAYVLRTLHERAPVVLFGYDFIDASLDSVRSDDLSGAATAVRYLIEHGRRRIGLVWALPNHFNIIRRRHGYLIALEQAGIRLDPRLESAPAAISDADSGFRATQELLERTGGRLDAVFCVTDPLATGCLRAIHESGLTVPEDISVIGYDDMSWVCHLTPPLTTMHVPSVEMGQRAVQRLISLAESRRRGETEDPVAIQMPVHLVVRGSVSRKRRGAGAVLSAHPGTGKEV